MEHFSSLKEFVNLEHVTKFILRAFQMNMRSLNDQFYQTLESYTADEFLWIGSVTYIHARPYCSIFGPVSYEKLMCNRIKSKII